MKASSGQVYLYDDPSPLKAAGRRPWASLLGGRFRECTWDNASNNFCDEGVPISAGVIVAHYTPLSMSGIQEKVDTVCLGSPNVTMIIVSGSGFEHVSSLPNLYYREAPVGDSSEDTFGGCFAAFLEHLNTRGRRLFRLLEPTDRHLIALDILCQGFLFASADESNGISSKRCAERVRQVEWWAQGLQVETYRALYKALRRDGVPRTQAKEIITTLEAVRVGPPSSQADGVRQVRRLLRRPIG